MSQREVSEGKSVEIEVNRIDIGRLSPEGPVVNSKTPVTTCSPAKLNTVPVPLNKTSLVSGGKWPGKTGLLCIKVRAIKGSHK